jgi:AbrB family looped-hinge helix DNA binding protein
MNSPQRLAEVELPQLLGSVKVGERGQVVIPQEARARMGIRPGEKLLAIGGVAGGAGLVFIKPETFNAVMAEVMGKLSRMENLLQAAARGGAAAGRRPSEAAAVLKKRPRRSHA